MMQSLPDTDYDCNRNLRTNFLISAVLVPHQIFVTRMLALTLKLNDVAFVPAIPTSTETPVRHTL
jgi:hypothetical protein